MIAEGLESLTLSELLALQLGRVADPTLLVDQLLLAIDAEELQELLGGGLSGPEPFSQSTVGEVAAGAGLTVSALAEALGRTPGQLPEAAAGWLAPAAGVLSVHGSGLKPVRHKVARAGRLSISTSASSAGIATLHKHHRLSVKLHADFRPLAGASSSAAIAVVLS